MEERICQCGCGQVIPYLKHHKTRPPKFIKNHGHRGKKREKADIRKLFWDKVDKKSIEECWEWTAYVAPNGYGNFHIEGKSVYAHRVAYELSNETKISKGLVVCHKCDNRKCVNPNHLFLGTQQDNIRDMFNKGRQHKVKPWTTKLNETKVRKIRELCALGYAKEDIAKTFGVKRCTIANIEARRLWKDI